MRAVTCGAGGGGDLPFSPIDGLCSILRQSGGKGGWSGIPFLKGFSKQPHSIVGETKETCVLTKETCVLTKETCVLTKETCILTTDTFGLTKEPMF